MTIKIDISYISDELKSAIQNAIKQKAASESQDNNHTDEYRKIVLYDNDRQKAKQLLEDVLKKNQFNDYIIVDNINEEDEIAILRKDDLEQLGIFVCSHCGTPFASEDERIIHQRMHYFV
ncbi:MAG TPA: C2H2-type zinc finger protein [Candidatus Nitrosocosmicus sp.]|jgi:hypothetical protein|nr:C2H2-type zinc finger protein [Candidatus Nitrosocosmicus sp.]